MTDNQAQVKLYVDDETSVTLESGKEVLVINAVVGNRCKLIRNNIPGRIVGRI